MMMVKGSPELHVVCEPCIFFFLVFLNLFFNWRLLYNIVLVSVIHQHDQSYVYIFPLPLEPPHSNPLGCHTAPGLSSWVVQQFPLAIYFTYGCAYVSMPFSPLVPSSPSLLCHKSVLYVCISIAALQILWTMHLFNPLACPEWMDIRNLGGCHQWNMKYKWIWKINTFCMYMYTHIYILIPIQTQIYKHKDERKRGEIFKFILRSIYDKVFLTLLLNLLTVTPIGNFLESSWIKEEQVIRGILPSNYQPILESLTFLTGQIYLLQMYMKSCLGKMRCQIPNNLVTCECAKFLRVIQCISSRAIIAKLN